MENKEKDNILKIIEENKNSSTLSLNNNQLTTIPNEIGNLINLKELRLSFNKLKNIPNEIGNLINLTYLNLSNNKIGIFPQIIFKLKKLNYFKINKNPIPNEIFEILNKGGLNNLEKYLIELREEILIKRKKLIFIGEEM